MRSPISMASSRSCVTNTMVLCSSLEQQQGPHVRADQRIERAEGLVHQQDVGIGRERAGEADALLHPAREVVQDSS